MLVNLVTMTPILLSWYVDTLELGVDEKDPYAPRGDVCIVELGLMKRIPMHIARFSEAGLLE